MTYEINFLILIVFVLQFFVGIGASFLFKNGISEYLQVYITQVIPIFLPALFCCLTNKNGFDEYKRDGKITLIKIICVIILALCVNFMVNIFIEKIYAPILLMFIKEPFASSASLLPDGGFDIALNIIFICFIPAIFEEILFRGVVLTRYESIYGSKSAIFMCGLVFALMHADIQSVVQQFIIGAFLSYIVIRYNSIYLGMIAHFVHNFTTLCLNIAGEANQSSLSFLTDHSLITFIICAFVIFGIMVLTQKTQKKMYFKESSASAKEKRKEKLLLYVIILLFAVIQILSLLS